jgi:hypothetical protein
MQAFLISSNDSYGKPRAAKTTWLATVAVLATNNLEISDHRFRKFHEVASSLYTRSNLNFFVFSVIMRREVV